MSDTYVSAELRRLTRERAAECCEYCLIPEIYSLFNHQIDHIIAEKHGGSTELGNLAFSCIVCNRRKGSDIASIDPHSNRVEALYNPRTDNWGDHFVLEDGRIDPLTATGRVTVALLQFNLPVRIAERRLLALLGAFHRLG